MDSWQRVAELERLRDRYALQRRMLEQQAVNSDLETFDFWADRIEACDKTLKHIALQILKANQRAAQTDEA